MQFLKYIRAWLEKEMGIIHLLCKVEGVVGLGPSHEVHVLQKLEEE